MKCLVIAAVLVAGAVARPGGHTGEDFSYFQPNYCLLN